MTGPDEPRRRGNTSKWTKHNARRGGPDAADAAPQKAAARTPQRRSRTAEPAAVAPQSTAIVPRELGARALGDTITVQMIEGVVGVGEAGDVLSLTETTLIELLLSRNLAHLYVGPTTGTPAYQWLSTAPMTLSPTEQANVIAYLGLTGGTGGGGGGGGGGGAGTVTETVQTSNGALLFTGTGVSIVGGGLFLNDSTVLISGGGLYSSTSSGGGGGGPGVDQTARDAITAETARAEAAEITKLPIPTLVSATPATIPTPLTKGAIQIFDPTANLTNTALPLLSASTAGDVYWLRNQSASFTVTQPFGGADTMASGSTSITLTHPGTVAIVAIPRPTGSGLYWDVVNHVRSDATLDNTFIQAAATADARTTIVGATAPGIGDGRDNDGYLVPALSKVSVYGAKTAGVWPTPIDVPALSAAGHIVDAYADHRITTGCTTWPRFASNGNTVTLPTGVERLAYFTCPQSFTANTLTIFAGGTAAVGTTYCALALYSIAANGDLTRLGLTTSDTTIFASTDGSGAVAYAKALTASVALVYGVRYAAGVLWVGSGTAPATHGQASSIFDPLTAPFIGASVSGQSTVPSTITAGSITGSSSTVYIKIT